jgi:hypothetical protein
LGALRLFSLIPKAAGDHHGKYVMNEMVMSGDEW